MELTLPVSAMSLSEDEAGGTVNQPTGNQWSKRLGFLLTFLLLTIAGIGKSQAQCTFEATDFTINDISDIDDLTQFNFATLTYSGSATLDSVHVIITEATTSWTDSVTTTEEDDWYINFDLLGQGQYTITLRPYCEGQAGALITDGAGSWTFAVTCTEENASVSITDVSFDPVCTETTTVTISVEMTCGASEDNLEFYLDDPDLTNYGAYDNTDGTYNNVTVGTHTFTVLYTTNGTKKDTTIYIGGRIEAEFSGADGTYCEDATGMTVTVTASGGTEPYTYLWSDDSTTSASFTITEGGLTPSVIISDNAGCIDTLSPTINWLPNATKEEWIVSFGSYTWRNDTTYTESLGSYTDTANGCVNTLSHNEPQVDYTVSGAAAGGCDSTYYLNLTVIDGIPVPASGHTDTTLATLNEGDTAWVYDNGGMTCSYALNADGSVTIAAPEYSTLAIDLTIADCGNIGDGDTIFFYDSAAVSATSFIFAYEKSSNPVMLASSQRNLTIRFKTAGVRAAGFKMPVTVKGPCSFTPGLADGEVLETIPTAFYFESVEDGELPDCWTSIAYDIYPGMTIYSDGDDELHALDFKTNATADHYAVMPMFDTVHGSMDKWVIHFTPELANLEVMSYDVCTEDTATITVGVMSDPSDPATFVSVKDVQVVKPQSNEVLVPLRGYSGSGLYPAFKMAAGSGHAQTDLLVSNVFVVPDVHLEAPTNLQVSRHPLYSDKVIVSWDCDKSLLDYDVDYGNDYYMLVGTYHEQGDQADINEETTENRFILDNVAIGSQLQVGVAHAFTDSRYLNAYGAWFNVSTETIDYIAPIYDKQATDTIGDLANTATVSAEMPIPYGSSAVSEILVTSDELQLESIGSMAIRLTALSCTVGGFQNVIVYMKDVDFEQFSSTLGAGTYTLADYNDCQFTSDTKKYEATVTSTDVDAGWMVITFDSSIVHDTNKSLLIGISNWAGDSPEGNLSFFHDAGSQGKGLYISGTDNVESIAETYDYDPVTTRPQMILFENKSCGGNNETSDTILYLCENATLSWRGHNISFLDDDIELHYLDDAYHYYDTVENAATGGCDSIYHLELYKNYNETNGYSTTEGDSYVEICGPYTWRNGVTYTESLGNYVYYESGCPYIANHPNGQVYDTVRGATADGCDSIYGLNLTINDYYTVKFDSTGVTAGTGMANQYVCQDEPEFVVPQCTMERDYYLFDGWLYDGDTIQPDTTISISDSISLTPIWKADCEDQYDYDEPDEFCGNSDFIYEWHGHSVNLDYLKANAAFMYLGDDISAFQLTDTVAGAVGGVCDSIYQLSVRSDIESESMDITYTGACPLGYTWVDDSTYTQDVGVDEFGNTNPASMRYLIDSTNASCHTVQALALYIDTLWTTYDTITYYYIQGSTVYRTVPVCNDAYYRLIACDTTREGYDFMGWQLVTAPAADTLAPGTQADAQGSVAYYAIWKSNCSNVDTYDTLLLCSTDTVEWHGYTWNGPQFTAGAAYDTLLTMSGVIPGECDSIFHLNIGVPNSPKITIDDISNVSCHGGSNGSISILVPTDSIGINPYVYNLTYQFKLDTNAYTSASNAPNYYWGSQYAGDHTVYAMDGCGLTDSMTVSITEPDAIVTNISSYTDSAVCPDNITGSMKQLNAEVEGGTYPYTYLWDDDSTRYNDTCMVAINVPGTYTVALAVTDANGCTGSANYTYTVYDTLSATVSGNDTAYCYGATVTPLTVTPAGGDSSYTYQWYNYTYGVGEEASYAPSSTTAATYDSLTVVVSNTCGEITVKAPSIVIYDSFYISNSYANEDFVCLNGSTNQQEVEVNGGGAYTAQWYKDGVAIDGATTNKYTPATDTAGTFEYTLTITSNAGCGSDSVDVLELTVYDAVSLTTTSDSTYALCPNTTDTLSVTAQGGDGQYSYQWYINGEIRESATESTINPLTDASGTFVYSVTVSNDCGTDSIYVSTVTVYDAFALTNNNIDGTYCFGATADSLKVSVQGGNEATYQWYANDTAIDGATSSSYVPATNSASIYTYTVRASNGCETDSVYVATIQTYDAVTASTTSVDTSYCAGGNADLLYVTAAGGDSSYNYQWYANGVPLDDNTSDNFEPPTDSAGSVITYSAKVSTTCGSDSIYIATITVFDTVSASTTSNDTAYCLNATAEELNISINGGYGTASYQWYKDGDAIDGATSDTYTPATDTDGSFQYSVIATNDCGEVSIDIATITVHSPDSSTVEEYACDRFVWDITGDTLTASADTSTVLTNAYGCDSTVTLHLTLNYSSQTHDTVSACDSYEWHFETYDSTGTYYISQETESGCDSSMYLHLTINHSTSATDSVTACDSLTWIDSNTYTQSTSEMPEEVSYTLTGGDMHGCDSVVTLNLTIAENYPAYFHSMEADSNFMPTIYACALTPQVVMPENEYEYEGHVFIGWIGVSDTVQPGDTVTLSEGVEFFTAWRTECSNVDTVEYATICEGDTLTWRGMVLNGLTQEYSDTVAGVVDELCDSVYHLTVTVNQSTWSDTTMQACDSVWWNGTFFTETPDTTQVYFMPGGNQWGCDSTARMNLTVNYSIHDYVVETACDSYTFDSVTYTESTDLPTIGDTAENGCPFITHISLTVNSSYHGEDSATACDMYQWNGMELYQDGEYNYEDFTVDGCDSIITLYLTLHYTTTGIDTQTACDSLEWIDGNTYFSDFTANTGEITYLMEGANQWGCDSIAMLDLTMMDHIYVEFLSDFGEGWMDEVSACLQKPLVVPQCEYTNEGFVFRGWTDLMSPDTVQPGDTLYLDQSVSYYALWSPLCEDVIVFTDTALCEGSTFVWHGHDYTNELFSGDYEEVDYGVIENYCDSVFYLRLTVYPTTLNEYYDSVSDAYYWHDEEYTASGTYERNCGRNRYGCDSTEVLHLIIYLGIVDPDEALNVKVYPNPTTGLVSIDGADIKKVSVIDLVGRTVATFREQEQIDISDLPSGYYTLRIETAQGNTTRRVIKR